MCGSKGPTYACPALLPAFTCPAYAEPLPAFPGPLAMSLRPWAVFAVPVLFSRVQAAWCPTMLLCTPCFLLTLPRDPASPDPTMVVAPFAATMVY